MLTIFNIFKNNIDYMTMRFFNVKSLKAIL